MRGEGTRSSVGDSGFVVPKGNCFGALDVLAIVYAGKSNVLKHFWEMLGSDALRLTLREAVVYALQVALGQQCDGSTKVVQRPEVADLLRDLLLRARART